MIIAATSDVHSPRYFEFFLDSINNLEDMEKRPDMMLIAGDMVHRGEIDEYERVYNAMFGSTTGPIVACFGNNEFSEKRDEVRSRFKNIQFLDDQSVHIPVRLPGSMRETVVGIVGTTGSLETPTPWQKANVPNIEGIYQNRVSLVERHLGHLRADIRILLMHYAPTYKTLDGENPRFFGSLGWNVYENVIVRQKPDIVIHGHSHRGSKMAWVDSVPVFNVAMPLNRKIVIIDTDKLKAGLEKFV